MDWFHLQHQHLHDPQRHYLGKADEVGGDKGVEGDSVRTRPGVDGAPGERREDHVGDQAAEPERQGQEEGGEAAAEVGHGVANLVDHHGARGGVHSLVQAVAFPAGGLLGAVGKFDGEFAGAVGELHEAVVKRTKPHNQLVGAGRKLGGCVGCGVGGDDELAGAVLQARDAGHEGAGAVFKLREAVSKLLRSNGRAVHAGAELGGRVLQLVGQIVGALLQLVHLGDQVNAGNGGQRPRVELRAGGAGLVGNDLRAGDGGGVQVGDDLGKACVDVVERGLRGA